MTNTLGIQPDRSMAWIVQISRIEKHPNADRLKIVFLKNSEDIEYGWQCITNHNYDIGDKVIYIGLDSIPDPNDPFNEDTFKIPNFKRIKTIKLRGEYSQGMILPMEALSSRKNPETGDFYDSTKYNIDDDVTKELDIRKYVNPEEEKLYQEGNQQGESKYTFPIDIVPKTDEDRVQSKPKLFMQLLNEPVVITQKIDGTSMTILKDSENNIIICSRNYILDNQDKNSKVYYEMFNKYNIEKILEENPNIVIQGEIAGENIQKNPTKLSGKKFFVFNMFDQNTKKFVSHNDTISLCQKYNLEHAPIVYEGILSDLEKTLNLDHKLNMSDLVNLSNSQKYNIGNQQSMAEGIVVKHSVDRRISFKVISPEYLSKEK